MILCVGLGLFSQVMISADKPRSLAQQVRDNPATMSVVSKTLTKDAPHDACTRMTRTHAPGSRLLLIATDGQGVSRPYEVSIEQRKGTENKSGKTLCELSIQENNLTMRLSNGANGRFCLETNRSDADSSLSDVCKKMIALSDGFQDKAKIKLTSIDSNPEDNHVYYVNKDEFTALLSQCGKEDNQKSILPPKIESSTPWLKNPYVLGTIGIVGFLGCILAYFKYIQPK